MALRYLFDHNARGAVARGLRRRGVDLRTAYEEGVADMADPDLLQRATFLRRVLYTNDDDLLTLSALWLEEGRTFTGIVYLEQNKRLSIGKEIEDLELIALAVEPEQMENQVVYLPL